MRCASTNGGMTPPEVFYESGSFEGSCDFTDSGCDCFEHDYVGDNDTIEDLQALCAAATTSENWLEGMKTKIDWQPWFAPCPWT